MVTPGIWRRASERPPLAWPHRAHWRPKQPNPLINDPFADALVKAVGLDYCNRMADGELDFDSDPLLDRERMCEQIAVRTRYFDDFLTSAAAAGIRQAVILASASIPGPTGCRGRRIR